MSASAELKPGDEVAIVSGRDPLGYIRRGIVERLTATQVVVEDMRFARYGGHAIGGYHAKARIEPWGPEHDEQVSRIAAERERDRIVHERLGKVRALKALTIDQLRRIEAIMDEAVES